MINTKSSSNTSNSYLKSSTPRREINSMTVTMIWTITTLIRQQMTFKTLLLITKLIKIGSKLFSMPIFLKNHVLAVILTLKKLDLQIWVKWIMLNLIWWTPKTLWTGTLLIKEQVRVIVLRSSRDKSVDNQVVPHKVQPQAMSVGKLVKRASLSTKRSKIAIPARAQTNRRTHHSQAL